MDQIAWDWLNHLAFLLVFKWTRHVCWTTWVLLPVFVDLSHFARANHVNRDDGLRGAFCEQVSVVHCGPLRTHDQLCRDTDMWLLECGSQVCGHRCLSVFLPLITRLQCRSPDVHPGPDIGAVVGDLGLVFVATLTTQSRVNRLARTSAFYSCWLLCLALVI